MTEQTPSLGKRKNDFFNQYFYYKSDVESRTPELNNLFTELLLENRNDSIDTYYEIISSHESDDIRDLALKVLKNTLPSLNLDQIRALFMNWLNYPSRKILPILNECKARLTQSGEINDKNMVLIAEMYEDKDKTFTEIELKQIEEFIKPYPLLYKPIQRKIDDYRENQISERINQEQQVILKYYNKYYLNLDDVLINKNVLLYKNPSTVWERLLNCSICHLIEYFGQVPLFKYWKPFIEQDKRLFEIIVETFAFEPLYNNLRILLEAMDVSDYEFQYYDVKIEINSYLLEYPEKIDYNVIKTGQIKWNSQENGTRTIIHLGVTPEFWLYEISLDAPNQEIQAIVNKINVSYLQTLLKPILYYDQSDFENILEILSSDSLKGKSFRKPNYKYRKFLQEFVNYQLSKRYTILPQEIIDGFSPINIISHGQSTQSSSAAGKIPIVLCIDFGNFKTVMTAMNIQTNKIISGAKFIKKSFLDRIEGSEQGAKIPSIIFFHSLKHELFGSCTEDDFKDSYIIWGFKNKIRNGLYENNVVEGQPIDLISCTTKFFNFLSEAIDTQNFDIKRIGFAYPIDSSPEYQSFLKKIILTSFNKYESDIFSCDEATSNCLGLLSDKSNLLQENAQYLVIDLGGGTTDCAVITIKDKFGKDIEIYSRNSDTIGGNIIEKKLYRMICQGCDGSMDPINKDKYIYRLGCLKIFCNDNHDLPRTIDLEGNQFEINLGNFIDAYKESQIAEKLKILVSNTMNDASSKGISKIDFVILAGGALKFRELENDIETILSPSFQPTQIISSDNPFSVALGLVHIAKGCSIHSFLLDEIVYSSNQISSIRDKSLLNFEILIPRSTPFPSPYFPFLLKYDSVVLDHLTAGNLQLYLIREIKMDFEQQIDISNVRKKEKSDIQILERIGENMIDFPISSTGEIQFYLHVDGSKKLILYYLDSTRKDTYHEFEIALIR